MKIDIQPDHFSKIGDAIRTAKLIGCLGLCIVAGLIIAGLDWISGGER